MKKLFLVVAGLFGLLLGNATFAQTNATDYENVILSTSGLLYYRPMQEDMGTTLLEANGGPSIELYNGALVNQSGYIGNAVSFDGIDDYGQTVSPIDLSAYDNIIVEALLYATPSGNTPGIYWKQNSGFTMEFAHNLLALANYGNTQWGAVTFNPTGNALYKNNWHHYVAVYDKSKGGGTAGLTLYVDGVALSRAHNPLFDYDTNITGTFSNDIFSIFGTGGVVQNRGVASGYITSGALQHLAIYHNLTTEEILTHIMCFYGACGGSSYEKYTIKAEDIWDNQSLYDSNFSPLSRFIFETNAEEIALEFQYDNPNAIIGVTVDGGTHYTFTGNQGIPSPTRKNLVLGNAGTLKTIEVINSAKGGYPYSGGIAKGGYVKNIFYPSDNLFNVISPALSSGRLVIYGDSITVGIGTSDPTSKSMISLLRNLYHRNVTSEGYGERTLWSDLNAFSGGNLVDKFVEYHPQTIWIEIGTNDYEYSTNRGGRGGVGHTDSPTDFGVAYSGLVDALVSALPDVKIVCQTPLLRSGEGPNTSGYTLGNYRDAIVDACADRENVFIVDGTQIMTLEEAKYLHPGDTGNAIYAEYIDNTLNQLYPYYTFTDGNTHTSGSNETIVFEIAKDISLLSGIRVNNTALISGNNYSSSISGTNTLIMLNAEYLNSLSSGNYLLTVTFTDGVSVEESFAILPEPTVPTVPSSPSYGGGGGGGGSSVVKDVCPNGDFSPSYYDGMCGETPTTNNVGTGLALSNNPASQVDKARLVPTVAGTVTVAVDDEIQSAYDWAFSQGITTLSPIENANLTGPLLRSHMAKMVVNYAVNVLGISPEMGITPPSLRDTSPAVLREGKIRNLSITQEDKESENNETPIFLSRSTAGVAEGGGAINAEGVIDTNKIPPTPLYERGNCTFSDIANQTQELQTYITQACQLGIMGVDMENFLPNDVVTRAQFGTILSRLLYGETFNGGTPYYANHLQALKENGIMTQIDNPEQRKELRQRVRLMLMRSSEK